MSSNASETGSSIIPCLRYLDAPAAIQWLCEAFGFEEQLVVPNGQGGIVHAQLRFGNGMIMLGSVRDKSSGDRLVLPESGGGETQASYVVVEDVDRHYARARKAGARIVEEVTDQEHGGRLYACEDLEGRLWYFGSYNPWSQQ